MSKQATAQRRTDPQKRKLDRLAVIARDHALTKLRQLYPDDYHRLLNVERVQLGLKPAGLVTRARGRVLGGVLQAASSSMPPTNQPVAAGSAAPVQAQPLVTCSGASDDVADAGDCDHPRASRRVFSWGAMCSACNNRV